MSAPRDHPRPPDTYDTASDGYAPIPLSGTIAALQRLTDAIAATREALAGCETPLNLTRTDEDLHKMQMTADSALNQLARAADIIEADVPLAGAFAGEAPWWECRQTVVLSPRQILTLADRAEQVSASDLVTYREALASVGNAEPSLIKRDRAQSAAAERRKAREELHDRILEDIENQPCPMCGAAPGGYCRTKSGRVGGPHAGRRDASPVAQEFPAAARHVKREDVEAAELVLQEQRDRAEPQKRSLEDRGLVGDVVAELADGFRLPGDRV